MSFRALMPLAALVLLASATSAWADPGQLIYSNVAVTGRSSQPTFAPGTIFSSTGSLSAGAQTDLGLNRSFASALGGQAESISLWGANLHVDSSGAGPITLNFNVHIDGTATGAIGSHDDDGFNYILGAI